MANVRIVLNDKAIQDLLKSVEVQTDLKHRADRIAAAAGEGMEVFEYIGKDRAHAGVFTDSFPARYHEARDRALTKAIDAGRD